MTTSSCRSKSPRSSPSHGKLSNSLHTFLRSYLYQFVLNTGQLRSRVLAPLPIEQPNLLAVQWVFAHALLPRE